MRPSRILPFVIVALTAPVSSASAAGWLAPVSLATSSGASYSLTPAMGADGTVAVVRDNTVWVKPAGAPFESASLLGAPAFGPSSAVAVGPDGAVAVLVQRGSVVSVYRRPAAGTTFLPPVDVTGVASSGNVTALAVDAAGTTSAAVVRSGQIQVLQIAKDGTVTGPVPVSATGRTASDPRFGTGAVNVLSYVTEVSGTPTVTRLEAAVAAPGAPFGPPEEIDSVSANSGEGAYFITRPASVRADGTAVMGYTTNLGGLATATVTVRAASLAGGVFTATTLETATGPSGPGGLYAVADAAARDDGSATVVWSIDGVPPPAALRRASVPPGGAAFGPAETFSPSGVSADAVLSSTLDLGALGTMLVVDQTGAPATRAAIAAPGSPFGQSIPVFDAEQDVGSVGDTDTAADRRGQVAVAREDERGAAGYTFDLGLYDGRAPELRAVDIPSGGAPGVPLTLRATAFDALSAPGTPQWSFGDGTNATGAEVSHTYAAPGRYLVSVTTTDAAGNTSAPSTRTVEVTAAPGPGGTPPPPTRDRVAPRLTALRFSPAVARRGRTAKASFVVSEAAKISVRVQRVRTGRKVASRCVRRSRKGARCEVVTTLVKRTAVATRARAKVTVTLATKRAKLPAGRFRVLVTATDAAGNFGTAKRTLTVRR